MHLNSKEITIAAPIDDLIKDAETASDFIASHNLTPHCSAMARPGLLKYQREDRIIKNPQTAKKQATKQVADKKNAESRSSLSIKIKIGIIKAKITNKKERIVIIYFTSFL